MLTYSNIYSKIIIFIWNWCKYSIKNDFCRGQDNADEQLSIFINCMQVQI